MVFFFLAAPSTALTFLLHFLFASLSSLQLMTTNTQMVSPSLTICHFHVKYDFLFSAITHPDAKPTIIHPPLMSNLSVSCWPLCSHPHHDSVCACVCGACPTSRTRAAGTVHLDFTHFYTWNMNTWHTQFLLRYFLITGEWVVSILRFLSCIHEETRLINKSFIYLNTSSKILKSQYSIYRIWKNKSAYCCYCLLYLY